MLGTPSYMAPEMLLSALRCDIRGDIFSLGVMLYEMLGGRLPFDAPNVADLISLHFQQSPVDLRDLRQQSLPRSRS